MKARDIGMGVKQPKTACTDSCCPFHGTLPVRGAQFIGVVEGLKMQNTAKIVWERRRSIPKYERYERRLTKISVHSTPCIKVKEGDRVRVMQCRPISKTKHYVIIENLGPVKGFAEYMEALEESKKPEKPKEPEKAEQPKSEE